MKCTVCDFSTKKGDYTGLSSHLTKMASRSDASHVMWLNRYITKKKQEPEELEKMLSDFFSLEVRSLKLWIIDRFVANFFLEPPHRFVEAMQTPGRCVLVGYVMEHYHFLKQWIRSCASVIAKTRYEDVQKYELENIITEMHGYGAKPSHHELLLRMGEALGIPRKSVMESAPLPATERGIALWDHIATNGHWIETMAAMHSLELIATRGLGRHGAVYPYFRPELFQRSDLPVEVKDFLMEGYEADASHSEEALNLIEKYASEVQDVQDIQAVFIRSMVAFDDYLNARLERGKMYENKL